jgi:hypothetical protein
MSNCILGVRVTPEDKDLLEKVSKARGEDISDFVRRAIKKELASLSFLPDYDKKALGVQVARHE